MAFRTSDTVVAKSALVADQANFNFLKSVLGSTKNNIALDARDFLNDSQENVDNYYQAMIDYDAGDIVLSQGHYYHDAALKLPDNFWLLPARYKYVYYYDLSNAVDKVLPDIPVGIGGSDQVERLSFILRRAAGNSFGSHGVDDIPTTWRNAVDVRTILLERQELTSAQQVGIMAGVEREVLAGMSSNYTATATTTRFVDFQNTSTGANDALVQADLVALGWNIINATSMNKVIAGFTWRVLHNS